MVFMCPNTEVHRVNSKQEVHTIVSVSCIKAPVETFKTCLDQLGMNFVIVSILSGLSELEKCPSQ